jgi:hypothetical protein
MEIMMKTQKKLLLVLFISTVLTACGSDSKKKTLNIDKDTPTEKVSVTSGIWQSLAYGVILEINDNDYQLYQTTTNFCQVQDADFEQQPLLNSIDVSNDQAQMTTTLANLKVPGINMTRIEALPDNCIDELITQFDNENYQFNAQQDFEIFWQTFREYYAFFHLENVNWDEMYQLANNQISDATTQEDLFTLFSEMIKPLKDFHVSLENEVLELEYSSSRTTDYTDIALADFIEINNLSEPFSQENMEDFQVYLSDAIDMANEAVAKHFSDSVNSQSNETETLLWGQTHDGFGYLHILTMDLNGLTTSQGSTMEKRAELNKTLDQIMLNFKGLKGLIIDVRYNDGGDDFVGHMITSRLISSELHAYSKQARLADTRTELQKIIIQPIAVNTFTGPIVLLVSESTSSGAETFSMTLRERENSILIGERTGGGFSDGLTKSLPHGLIFNLSNEYYLTPSGEEFEGLGVPVDIQQDFFTLAQRESLEDYGLDKAIAWLLAQQN